MKLASAIGVSFQQLQKYESGTDRVSAGRLVQIAEYLKLPVSSFFLGLTRTVDAKLKSRDAELLAFVGSTDGRRIARTYLSLKSPAVRKLFLKLVGSFKE